MKREADALGLQGWVRNRLDGTVEAVIAGDETQIGILLDRCRSGPPLARVTDIAVTPSEMPEQGAFETRPKA